MADTIAKGLSALRRAVSSLNTGPDRAALLEMHDALLRHQKHVTAIIQAADAGGDKTKLFQSAKAALQSAGVSQALLDVGADAAASTVGVEGSLDIPADKAGENAWTGGMAALVAQCQAMEVGVLTTPGGARAVASLREGIREQSGQRRARPVKGELSEWDAIDGIFDEEMTADVAVSIGAAVGRYTTEGKNLQLSVKQAIWDHGLWGRYNPETFRRRLYRSGNVNQNDPALCAYEVEIGAAQPKK